MTKGERFFSSSPPSETQTVLFLVPAVEHGLDIIVLIEQIQNALHLLLILFAL